MKIILSLIGLFILLAVLWRLGSKRYVLPCPSWLGWMVELDNPFTHINRSKTIIQHLDLQKNMTVIDIGCGPGRVTIPMAKALEQDGKIVAMDLQSNMLKKTQNKANELGLKNITFLQGSLGDGRLDHAKYDRALLVTVLGEIPAQQVALEEIFTALKPGGLLSITEIIFDPHFQRKAKVLKLAESVGFRLKTTYGRWYAYTMNFEKPHPDNKRL